MSAAYSKLVRESFIPTGAIKVTAKDSESVVYLKDHTREGWSTKYYAVGFAGKAIKPTFNYWFKSEDKRTAYVADWFKAQAANKTRKQAKQEERKASLSKPHNLNVGDILRASWGYEQTNIDYYQVTALVGIRTVEIRKIGCESIETMAMQGESVPCKNAFIGKPMRKQVSTYDNQSVKIESFAYAHLMVPTMVAGIPVYRPSHWTAYA